MLKKISASAKLYLLIFITAASLLGLGLYGISYLKKMNEITRTLYADRVLCMQQLANCRYEYAGVILQVPEKVKEHILAFNEAKMQIENAEKSIDTSWNNYKLTYLTSEEALLVKQTEILKRNADEATENLKTILSKKDTAALFQFIHKNSFTGPAPIVKNLSRLMELQVRVADEVFSDSKGIYQHGSTNFWLLIFLALVVTLSLSFYIIINVKNLIKNILESRNIIQQSEVKYRSLIERASDAIFVVDKKGNYTEVNESMCEMTGYSRDELLQLNVVDMVDPEQLKTDPILYGRDIPNNPYKRERRFIRKDRTLFEVEVNANLLFDENLLVIARDITERKKMESELREAETKFRTAFEYSAIGIAMVSIKGNWLKVNISLCQMMGYSEQEFLAMTIFDITHQGDDSLNFDIINSVLSSEMGVAQIEKRYIRKNGTELWASVNIAVIRDDTGIPLYFVTQIIDISERKKSEEAQNLIAENEEKLRAIFDNVDGSACLIDTEFRLIAFNKVFAKFSTLLAGKATELGDEPYAFLPPEEKKHRYEILDRVLEGKKEELEVEYDRNGEHLYYRTMFTPVIVNGKVTAISSYTIDFTERKKAELLIIKEKELSETIINSLPGVFYLQSVSGEFLRWNRNFEVLTGYSKDEIKNLKIGELITEEDREKVQDTVIKVFADGYAIVEARAKMKDGTRVPFLLTGIPIEYEGQFCLLGTGIDISSRIKAEEELRQSEKKYKLLFENNPVPMSMIAKDDLSIIAVNEATCDLYGYTREELLQMDIKKMRPVEDLDLQAASYEKEIAIPTDFGVAKHLKKDGTVIYVNIISQDILFEERLVRLSLTNNVTEKIKAEEELRSSEQKYRLLFERNPVPLTMVAKDDLAMIAVNQAAADLYGYTREELLQLDASVVRLEEDLEEQRQHFLTDVAGPTDRGIVRHVRKDGSIIFVNRIVNDITFNGRAVRLVLSTDITEKLIAEEALKKSEANLKTIMDATDIAYVLLDKGLNVVTFNNAAKGFAEVLFSKPIKKGQQLEGYLPADRFAQFIKFKDEVLNGITINYEINRLQEDGSKRWFNVRLFPVIQNQNEIFGLMVAVSDVTNHKNSEIHLEKLNESLEKQAKELATSNAELEQFAFIASHDLQEPLRMVTSFMALLEKKYSDLVDDRGKQYIYFAVDGAKRMRQIILDLLDFSRVGRIEDKQEDVDLNIIVNETISLNRRIIEKNGARVIFESLPVIHTFKIPMRQVFQNLIGNSLKYRSADKEPVVSITGSETKTHYQFSVNDNGIGIAPEYFDKIFVIFQRLHNKDEYSGTGMGLSITKKIVESLGGKIWVESSLGNGSTFHFTMLKNKKA